MVNGINILLFLLSFIIYLELLFSSVHTNNKKNDILVLGKGPAQGLDYTTIKPEAKYFINITKPKKIYLSLHYNGSNSLLYAN